MSDETLPTQSYCIAAVYDLPSLVCVPLMHLATTYLSISISTSSVQTTQPPSKLPQPHPHLTTEVNLLTTIWTGLLSQYYVLAI